MQRRRFDLAVAFQHPPAAVDHQQIASPEPRPVNTVWVDQKALGVDCQTKMIVNPLV
jgi:hypothetical protein